MLKCEIENAKRAVTTDTVSISVGEVATMYRAQELNILPDFQRLFRWTDDKKSNFIESILIGIPIPPAFVYENEDGTWELIDGLQRISTLLEFMGMLRDPDTGQLKRSVLIGTKYLPSLQGVAWKPENDDEIGIDTSLQLFYRRHRIDFQILKHPSDPNTKYDLFQRLNRGGSYANEQEVRSCAMVLANADATRMIREQCTQSKFKKIFRITKDQSDKQKDVEYMVRMMVHSRSELPSRTDVQEFLSSKIIDILSGTDAIEAIEDAEWVVTTLYRILGENALIPPEERAPGIAPKFSLRALEAIAVGMIRNKHAIEALKGPDLFIKDRVSKFESPRESRRLFG